LLLLLPHSDPQANNSEALYAAAARGHSSLLRVLLPVSNALDQNSRSLARAAGGGRVECVRLLLPHCDPQADNSRALAEAFLSAEWEIFELLYPLSNAAHAQRHIPAHSITGLAQQQWAERVAACQKRLLEDSVAGKGGARARKM